MQRRGEFRFPGSPARELLPPRPPASLTVAPRYDDEEVRWLQASRQASPDYTSGGSGTPSPQLWAHHHQLHRPYPASAGSSPSRAQAIAGYRREMLDLVRGLPESAYELSLRDIVERPLPPATSSPPPPSAAARQQHATDATAKSDEPAAVAVAAAAGMDAAEAQVQEGTKKQSGSGKKQGRKQRMRKQRSRSLERSVSLDTGLLIKLFLPLSIGGKKKVSPLAKDGKKKDKEKKKKKKGKQGKKEKEAAAAAAKEEDEWSKSEFSEAGGSSSRTSSTGSSSNSSAGSVRNGHVNGGVGANPRAPARSWSRKRTGCYAFFRTNKNKSGAGQE